MKYKFLLAALILVLLVVVVYRSVTYNDEAPVVRNGSVQVSGKDHLTVKVFYEVLCPDSKHFIVRQLYPAWQKLREQNISHLVTVILVPYGKAMHRLNNGKYTFNCQHGEEECRQNRIHACLLDNESISFEDKLEKIKCSMADPRETTDRCGLTDCADGDRLLFAAGEETNNDLGPMNFVPTITINKKSDGQPQLLKNLYSEIMNRLQQHEM